MKTKMTLTPKVAPSLKMRTSVIYAGTAIALVSIAGSLLFFYMNIGRVDTAAAATASYTANNNGSWTSNATWAGGVRPATANIQDASITIKNGKSVTSSTLDAKNKLTLTIEANATLTINGDLTVDNDFVLNNFGTLIITGSLVAKNGAKVTINGGGTVEITNNAIFNNNATLKVNGNLQVGGDVSFDNNQVFNGTGTVSIGGSGCGTWTGSIPCSSGSATMLPVELTSFNAKDNGDGTVFVTWETASQKNNDYFTIQRSKDGLNYDSVGTNMGEGTTSSASYYEFVDKKPIAGKAYYRLAQTDYDGTREVFAPVRVELFSRAAEGTNDMRVFPNPLVGRTLTVELVDSKDGMIQILDGKGNSVLTRRVNEGDQSIQIDFLSELSPGIYYVNYKSGAGLKTVKIIKK